MIWLNFGTLLKVRFFTFEAKQPSSQKYTSFLYVKSVSYATEKSVKNYYICSVWSNLTWFNWIAELCWKSNCWLLRQKPKLPQKSGQTFFAIEVCYALEESYKHYCMSSTISNLTWFNWIAELCWKSDCWLLRQNSLPYKKCISFLCQSSKVYSIIVCLSCAKINLTWFDWI